MENRAEKKMEHETYTLSIFGVVEIILNKHNIL